jgi:uncharacterized protein
MRKSTTRSTAREIFVDTSGLYALIDRRDGHHPRASALAVEFVNAGRRLLVSDYVVCETVNLAQARAGTYMATRVLDLVETSVGIRLEWIGAERVATTRAFFRRNKDHRYSFTDCTSFVLMGELRIASALTSDRHFIEAGFDALLAS